MMICDDGNLVPALSCNADRHLAGNSEEWIEPPERDKAAWPPARFLFTDKLHSQFELSHEDHPRTASQVTAICGFVTWARAF